MKIYTIRDQVAGFFLPPYTAPNNGIAVRMFISGLSDSFPHRSDFSLHLIGEFSDDTGELKYLDPEIVINGASIAEHLDPRPRPASKENSK